jgi:hypothetical protein
MGARGKNTIKVGLTVGLSLAAIIGLVGCGEQAAGDETGTLAAEQSDNGLSGNGLSMNGLAMNGLSMNGLSMNGLSMNGLSMNGLSMNGLSMNGLSTSSGLMTTNGGRDVVKYLIKCALPAGTTYTTTDQNGYSYSYDGSLGVASEWATGACGKDCQERLSACLLAHVNNAGAHISLWLDGEGAIGWGKSTDFPYMEGAFFGNLITNQNSNNVAGGWQGYYCNGADYDQGSVPGRLGAALTSTVYQNWYGTGVLCSNGQYNSNKCYMHSDNSGFDKCIIAPNGSAATYNHVVTVWRNFEKNMPYKVCGYGGNMCLAVTSTTAGSNVVGQNYSGSAMQQWYITQQSPGKYNLVNVASGLALDMANPNGAVQNAYTGANSQLISVNVLGNSQAGRFAVVPSSSTLPIDAGYSNGAQIKIVAQSQQTTDSAKLVLTGIVGGSAGSGSVGFDPSISYSISPRSATDSSIDIASPQAPTVSQTDGTAIQEYTSWSGDTQNFNILASGSNWLITLHVNNAKCVGTVGNGIANGTQLEVQDCNGAATQSWSATTDGTTGSVIFKNVGAGRCMDVPNSSTANGTRMQIYDCWNTNGQKYSVN